MSPFRLLAKEVRHRLLSFALGLLAVAAAATLFISLLTTGRASNIETKRLMRNLGFNLLIVPKETDMADFWAADFAKGDMPEEYARRLAGAPGIDADHYIAVLQKRIELRGRQVLLTGLLPEQTAVDARKKAPMGYRIERGSCYVGSALTESLGIKARDTIEVLGKDLTVERVLLETGSKEDIRLQAHLRDVQEMLGMPGRINTIEALGCLCTGELLSTLRDQIAKVLPDTRVTELGTIASARSQTRKMVEQHVGLIMGFVLVVCALWVGLLALLNVRERRQEIGILRALGFGSGRIGVLFIGRAVLMGALGALTGFAAGTALAMRYGADIFKLTFEKVQPAYDLIVPTLAVATLVAALASLIPAMIAVTQDPALTLTEE